MDCCDVERKRWAIILAGGDGTRLSSYTRHLTGRATPKQFCCLVGRTSLLQQTMERVSLIVDRDRVLTALTRAHEPYYAPLIADVPARQLVIQPANLDTAPAVLYSLLRLSIRSPLASVALIPSDHYVSDNRLFMRHVELAYRAVNSQSDLVVLLGIPPDAAETGYGWIEPGSPALAGMSLYPVNGFWEKPCLGLARELFDRGCLWNSFVVVAQVRTLLSVFEDKLPNLSRSFLGTLAALETQYEPRAVEALYANLQPTNFSQRVLSRSGLNLAVLPVRGLEWSDLGEARRVMDTLSRIQMKRS
ncbi:MAG: sugar phosphate nucleotidyltransferase [Candidatus Binataceae bacterium]